MISKSKSRDHHGVELQSRVIKIDPYISKYAAQLLITCLGNGKKQSKVNLDKFVQQLSTKIAYYNIFIKEQFFYNFTHNNYQIQSSQ